jgi:hypothetical protein
MVVVETDHLVDATRLQRDATMLLLIAQSQNAIQQLALLASHEKSAVTWLVAVGEQVAAYACATQPDEQVLVNFKQILAALSPPMANYVGRPRPLVSGKESVGSEARLAEMVAITREANELLAALSSQEQHLHGKARV